MRRLARALGAGLLAAAVCAQAAAGFDPALERLRVVVELERSRVYLEPSYQVKLRAATVEGVAGFAALFGADPDRLPLTLCATRLDASDGDVRL